MSFECFHAFGTELGCIMIMMNICSSTFSFMLSAKQSQMKPQQGHHIFSGGQIQWQCNLRASQLPREKRPDFPKPRNKHQALRKVDGPQGCKSFWLVSLLVIPE
jgi:hypothetical protein